MVNWGENWVEPSFIHVQGSPMKPNELYLCSVQTYVWDVCMDEIPLGCVAVDWIRAPEIVIIIESRKSSSKILTNRGKVGWIKNRLLTTP